MTARKSQSKSAPAAICAPPALGQVWAGQGGVYAGLVRDADGGPDYYLIIGPEAKSKLDWQSATDWAVSLKAKGHTNFVLPNRPEASVARVNARELFQNDWYWLREQHADDSSYAWLQSFHDGCQGFWGKSLSTRARAVRRLSIQSFGNLDRS